jgi:hypothetical protein
MKRIIAALSFALLAAPVFAADIGAPYEQTVADMARPNVKDPVISGQKTVVAGPASAGASTEATGVWANDPNFIAPPQ